MAKNLNPMEMTAERREKIALRQAAYETKMREIVAGVEAKEGTLHMKVDNTIYNTQAYMPEGLTQEAIILTSIHDLDNAAAVVRAHGVVSLEQMQASGDLRKVNSVVQGRPGTEVATTTYREFNTHNPNDPEKKIVIHGHTNVSLRVSGQAGHDDILESRKMVAAAFAAHYGKK